MQRLIFTNSEGVSINLTAGNFGIVDWGGLSHTELNIQSQQVPFEDGAVFLDALMEPREIELKVAIYDGNDLELRYRKKRELISVLSPKIGEGTLIYTNDHLSKQIKALPQIPLFENKNSNDAGTLKASVVFTCNSPYWEDLADTQVFFKLGEIPTIKNEGDVPCQMEIDFFTTNVKNPGIVNLNTNKKIVYKGDLTNNLYINTNVGQKRISSENLGLEILNNAGIFKGLIYSDKLLMLCAVTNESFFYSYDGIKWQNEVFKTEDFDIKNVHAFEYSDELDLFVMYAETFNTRTFLTSSDGINWKSLSSYHSGQICYDIKYFNKLHSFIAVMSFDGNNIGVVISSDGINWTGVNTGIAGYGTSICYSEKLDLFVLVGFENIQPYNAKILTSSDCINWTDANVSSEYKRLRSVTYSEKLELFVTVGEGIYVSNDGESWEDETPSIAFNELLCVTYSEKLELFVTASDIIFVSSDGYNWLKKGQLASSGNNTHVVYSDTFEKFIINSDYGVIAYSVNGLDWENIGNTIFSSGKIIYIKELKKYIVRGSVRIYSTTDFKTFASSIGTSSLMDIMYSKKFNLVLGTASGGWLYKFNPNDLSYTSIMITEAEGATLQSIIYSEKLDLFIIVGYNGIILTSSNLEQWNKIESNTNKDLTKIYYSIEKDLFIAVGEIIMTSKDAINWVEQVNIDIDFSENYLTSVIYARNLFITLSLNYVSSEHKNKLFVSEDGENWKEITNVLNDYDSLRVIAYSDKLGLFMIVGNNGIILISSDLENWLKLKSNATADLAFTNYFENIDAFLICGLGFIFESKFMEAENQIKYLSPDSDINLNLKVGDNDMRLIRDSGNFTCRIKYRQKYIGV